MVNSKSASCNASLFWATVTNAVPERAGLASVQTNIFIQKLKRGINNPVYFLTFPGNVGICELHSLNQLDAIPYYMVLNQKIYTHLFFFPSF